MPDSGRRLTSWKEIAAYLGREVRTVMRWEKARALPVHRGSGARAGVVFAETRELDAWMRGDATPIPLSSPAASVPRPATRRWLLAVAAALTLAGGVGGWRLHGALPNDAASSAVMTEHAVIARHADGTEKWRYEFTAATVSPPFARASNPIEPLGPEGLLAATSNAVRNDIPAVTSGQLLWFDALGTLTRSFSFEDAITIGSRVYTAPWSISDFQVEGGASKRIAVASSHFEWWPSLVTILDSHGRRTGTFVHAGWVEHLRWLPEDRLLVTGFSNLKDGGMAALLDASELNGQSPADPGSTYDCSGCGPHRPLRYVVMPRSEVNRVSAGPFNRADVTVRAGGFVVRTTEVRETAYAPPAEALYEFTSQLELVHASYSDRYWEAHRELERVGRIAHPRERCPDREGPPTIETWDPASGWRVQSLRRVALGRPTL
jgi:hypothetical protein